VGQKTLCNAAFLSTCPQSAAQAICAKHYQTSQKVPRKAQPSKIIFAPPIDAFVDSRYSQAQITDLLAYANPRSSQAAQSLGSPLRRASQPHKKPTATPLSLCRPVPCAAADDKLYAIKAAGFGPHNSFATSTRALPPGGYSSVAPVPQTPLSQRLSGGQRTH